jgi:hydroxypyruvate isomerase
MHGWNQFVQFVHYVSGLLAGWNVKKQVLTWKTWSSLSIRCSFSENRLGEICQTCQWKQAQESFTRLGVSNAACHARANKPNLVHCLACQVDNGCRCWWWSTQG